MILPTLTWSILDAHTAPIVAAEASLGLVGRRVQIQVLRHGSERLHPTCVLLEIINSVSVESATNGTSALRFGTESGRYDVSMIPGQTSVYNHSWLVDRNASRIFQYSFPSVNGGYDMMVIMEDQH